MSGEAATVTRNTLECNEIASGVAAPMAIETPRGATVKQHHNREAKPSDPSVKTKTQRAQHNPATMPERRLRRLSGMV
ncbi:hypothetical protein, partial [Mycobacterium avium]|uniref:hypothetical protein n=1 Tax=Mycobacterium avium TaxID=1764 RepID=UPI001F275CCB